MGARWLIVFLGAACSSAPPTPAAPARPDALPDRVAYDFERAVLKNKDAYVGLFNFVSVGEYEILLHRYDILGRLPNLQPERRTQMEHEDGTPYPETRERRNVGNFYDIMAQRTVGTGGCHAGVPRTHYGKLLGTHFDELPAGTPPGYEKLRTDANHWLENHGGVVGIRCDGGKGSLAIVYTAAANDRGFELITIYDD
jgi:hypothetical protein